MSLVDDNLADWRVPGWRERDLKELAQFFNNYKIALLEFGTTDKNLQCNKMKIKN